MTVLRGAAWACALVAGSLVVAGCTPDEPEPTPTTPVETSTTSSAPETSEPTAAAPEMPAKAGAQTPEGAATFSTYWVSLMNYAYSTGDAGPLSAASHPDCAECQGFVDDLAETLNGGNRIEGGVVTLENVVGGEVSAEGVSIVGASYSQEDSRTLSPSGEVVETTPGGPEAPVAIYCQSVDGQWLVRRVVAVQ